MPVGWGGRVHVNRRSMNVDLIEGMTDGSQKKIMRDHGGIVEETSIQARRELNDYFKMAQAPLAYHLPVPPFEKVRA